MKNTGRNSLVDRLTDQVGSRGTAVGLLKKRGQMTATGQLTAKGQARNAMTASERAIDRARKSSPKAKPATAYIYNPKTNRATLRRGQGKTSS